jgi:hypothetical protein
MDSLLFDDAQWIVRLENGSKRRLPIDDEYSAVVQYLKTTLLSTAQRTVTIRT